MTPKDIQTLVEDAIFEFTMGNNEVAKEKLLALVQAHSNCFEACLALAEIACSESHFTQALEFAEKAYALKPHDIHIHTTLSRIWMQLGDKSKAEHFGAQARMLGWKNQLQADSKSLKDPFFE